MKAYLNLFNFKQKVNYKNEILSGLTVAIALIPEAIAFALLAGLSPLTGLYAAFVMSFVTTLFGGRPAMISGATGSVAVVLVVLAKKYGVEYVLSTVVLAGILQAIAGFFRLGKFIRLVPQPVIFGFLNGLAIIIFMAQLPQFKTIDIYGVYHWLSGTPMYIMLGLTLLTIAIIYFIPKFTKVIPASLVGILVISALVIGFSIPTKTVGDIASIKGGFPPFHIPDLPFTWETLKIIFPFSLIMAGVGLVESLLTLTVIDEITETRGRANKEAVAQGLANITSGFFSGMGGCAMIGQSLINISSGARARLSGFVASLMLLVFVMFAADYVAKIPMAALVGVMVMVSVGTFEWASLRTFGKMPFADILVMLVVMTITVTTDNLALAVLMGVIISALVFSWNNAVRIRARKYIDESGVKHYEIYGPLFFASTAAFAEKFSVLNDPPEIIIDFKESRIVDMSGIEALNKLTERYKKVGKTLHLRHLSEGCRKLLKNAESIIEVNILEDPHYKLVVDKI
jgi:SulP family sulfate permease